MISKKSMGQSTLDRLTVAHEELATTRQELVQAKAQEAKALEKLVQSMSQLETMKAMNQTSVADEVALLEQSK